MTDLLDAARTILASALLEVVYLLRPDKRPIAVCVGTRGRDEDFYAEWPASERDAWPMQEAS